MARPRVGRTSVARMRMSVVLPAPLWPTSATASPCSTAKETLLSAHWVASAKGCRRERRPESAGGKYFSRLSTAIAGAGILRSYNRTSSEESTSNAQFPRGDQNGGGENGVVEGGSKMKIA